MLLRKKLADSFLYKYQIIMVYLNNGEIPSGMHHFAAIRPEIYECIDEINENMVSIVGHSFISSLRKAVFGQFIYLKKYNDGYVFQHVDSGQFYQVLGLTSPIDDLCPEFSIVETALIPYEGTWVCDGLLIAKDASIGPNMSKELRDGYKKAKLDGSLVKIA